MYLTEDNYLNNHGYLTYDEYLDMGGTLDSTVFLDYVIEAEAVIDWYTFNRLQNEETIPLKVKQLVFKLIKIADEKNKALSNQPNEGNVSMKANDGVQVQYNLMSQFNVYDFLRQDSRLIIRRYLSGVKNSLGQEVLYRGLYPNE